MKQSVGPAICAVLLLLSSAIYGQTAASDEMYVNCMKLFGGLRVELLSKNGPAPKAAKLLQNSAALLADEAPPSGQAIGTVPGGRKVLSDEDIYAKRKNSVFTIGKIMKANDSTRPFLQKGGAVRLLWLPCKLYRQRFGYGHYLIFIHKIC